MAKPVDLIVASTMQSFVRHLHIASHVLGRKKAPLIATVPTYAVEQVARQLLIEIAHEADIDIVYAALAACKAPDSPDMIKEGLQAVRDRQKA